MSVVQQVFESYVSSFLLGSNGRGLCSCLANNLLCFRGEVFALIFGRGNNVLAFAYCVAMAREGLVSFVLVGFNGESVTRRLRRETPFRVIFRAYVGHFGYDQAVTRFFT